MVADVTDTAGSIRARGDYAWGTRGMGETPWHTCDGDEVRINGVRASEIEREDRYDYSRIVDAADPNRTFTFTLDRKGEDPVEATVTLAAPYEILAPTASQMLSRSTDFELQWSPSAPDNTMSLQLFEEIGGGICLITEQTDRDYKGTIIIPDEGSYTIPAGAIQSPMMNDCDASIILGRFSFGNYPDELVEDGFIEGRVLRAISFLSVE